MKGNAHHSRPRTSTVALVCCCFGFLVGLCYERYIGSQLRALPSHRQGIQQGLESTGVPALKARSPSLVAAKHWEQTCGYSEEELAAISALPHGHKANEPRWYHPTKKEWMTFHNMSLALGEEPPITEMCLVMSTKGQAPCMEEECLHQVYMKTSTTDVVIALVLLELSGIYGPGYEALAEYPDGIEYILDAGGNIGLAAMFFATLYPKATILTVEPNDQNFNTLLKNTANYPNIHAIKAGVWWRKTELSLYEGAEVGLRNLGFMVEESDKIKEDEVKVLATLNAVSVPSIMKEYRIPRFDLVKIDIEGSEKEVLTPRPPKYKTDWFEKAKIVIMEVHEKMRAGAQEAADKAIKRFGDQLTSIPLTGGDFHIWVRKDLPRQEVTTQSDNT